MDKKDILVLIVDDNVNNLRVLGSILSARGFKIALAANGKECFDFMGKQQPDLIFLDIMMPDINGFDVCRKIKQDDKTDMIPIIFVSALSNPQQIIKAFESGGVDYITKPFNKDEIYARAMVHIRVKKEREKLVQKIEVLEAELKKG